MAKMTVDERLQKARTQLVIGHPFFATLALNLKMVERKENNPTMCTDGKHIFYNPEFVDTISDAELMGVIAHEALHPGFLHHTRIGSRDPRKWNMAADHAINPIIIEAGMQLPADCLNDPKYKDMSAEQIYTLLEDDDQDDGKGGNGNGNEAWNIGSIEPAEGQSEEERKLSEQEWKQNLAAAAHIAKMAGNLPGSIERMIDSTLATDTPWRDMLWSYLTEKTPDDVSFSRPNRRFVWQGTYLPSTVFTVTGELVVMVDTSGSIGQHELDIFGAEVNGIHSGIRPTRTIVIYCDSNINRVDEFAPEDEVVLKLCGGGGTDFRPPFEYLKEKSIRPHAAVYLTDGYGPFPEEPDYPVVWAINNDNVEPPFGRFVRIKE